MPRCGDTRHPRRLPVSDSAPWCRTCLRNAPRPTHSCRCHRGLPRVGGNQRKRCTAEDNAVTRPGTRCQYPACALGGRLGATSGTRRCGGIRLGIEFFHRPTGMPRQKSQHVFCLTLPVILPGGGKRFLPVYGQKIGGVPQKTDQFRKFALVLRCKHLAAPFPKHNLRRLAGNAMEDRNAHAHALEQLGGDDRGEERGLPQVDDGNVEQAPPSPGAPAGPIPGNARRSWTPGH